MHFDLKLAVRTALVCLLAATFALPQNMFADSHVVTSADLQKEAVTASQTRQQNILDVQQFLSTPAAQKALSNAKVNPEQVKTAVSQLNDAELAQMASRAHKAQADFAAGTLSDRDLVLIILGLVALILIIVAVR
ncbi:MAG TPA: PA2779 family protein [Terriglobales bacterium]|nr:PA2779 family protein [Terriglobales bacterium]